jgi:hypothetical protein
MSKRNVSNLLYFEGLSMKELYDCLKSWQNKNEERFLSLDIQKDSDNFCCIAVINPVEVQETKDAKYGEADAPKYSDSRMLLLTMEEMKDLVLWYDKAKTWHLKGKGNAVDWESKHLHEVNKKPYTFLLIFPHNIAFTT